MNAAPGDIHQDVQLPIKRNKFFECRLDGGLLRDIDTLEVDCKTAFMKLGGDLSARFAVDIEDDDGLTLPGQASRHRAPNVARSAGHQRKPCSSRFSFECLAHSSRARRSASIDSSPRGRRGSAAMGHRCMNRALAKLGRLQ